MEVSISKNICVGLASSTKEFGEGANVKATLLYSNRSDQDLALENQFEDLVQKYDHYNRQFISDTDKTGIRELASSIYKELKTEWRPSDSRLIAVKVSCSDWTITLRPE